MARMIPNRVLSEVDGHETPLSEKKVYSALRDTLEDDYTAFGWVAWQSVDDRGRPAGGEADFVVAHPQRGFLVLEVKGGGIRLESKTRTWRSQDRTGTVHTIKDPFQQAARSRYEIAALLKKKLGLRTLPFPHGHGVIFADADGDPRLFGAEARPESVVMRDDLPRLGARIERMFAAYTGSSHAEFPPRWSEDLERLIAPSCELNVRLGSIVDDAAREIRELTVEQFSVLDSLARNRRVLVSGAAGTGKTMLALEKARRLAGSGARTLLTCFNRPLADFLSVNAADVPGLVVHNFHQLCYRWARRNGFTGIDPDSPAVRDAGRGMVLDREYFDRTLPEAFVASLKTLEARFDAVVVDEAQDFSDVMQDALLGAMRLPQEGYLFVFQDEGQSIFEARSGWRPAGLLQFDLKKNMRNSQRIHGVLKRMNPNDESVAIGPEGVAPEFIEAADPATAARIIEERIRAMTTREGIRLGQIAVLTGGKAEVLELAPEGRLRGFEVTQDPFDSTGRLYLDRISRFKGLERDVVILTRLANPPRHNRPEPLLYVGASRARSHLIVVDSADVLARFRAQNL